jgi:hypothetical protein
MVLLVVAHHSKLMALGEFGALMLAAAFVLTVWEDETEWNLRWVRWAGWAFSAVTIYALVTDPRLHWP